MSVVMEAHYKSFDNQIRVAKLVAADIAAATGAAFCVAPVITLVDRSIIQNASGAKPLGQALKDGVKDLLLHPQRFIRRLDFLWIWGLYTATYVAANTIDTVCEITDTKSAFPKFVGTTAVNMPVCILKDRAFTRMFGIIAPTNLPKASYGLFATRDSLTIAASFSLPKHVSAHMQENMAVNKGTADTVAQLACPMAVQFISTPLHLLGLDLYNNKTATTGQRIQFVKREYLKSAVARISRIGPAFGIGGIGNKYIRENLREKVC